MKSLKMLDEHVQSAPNADVPSKDRLANLYSSDREDEGIMNFDQTLAYEAAGPWEQRGDKCIHHMNVNTRHTIKIPMGIISPEHAKWLMSALNLGAIRCDGTQYKIHLLWKELDRAAYSISFDGGGRLSYNY